MSCNFEKLCSYVNNELDVKGRQEIIAHMNRCEICLEAVCLMLEDQCDDLIPPSQDQDTVDVKCGLEQLPLVGIQPTSYPKKGR